MSNVPPPFSSNYPRQQDQWGNYVRPPGVYFDTLQIAFDMLQAGFLQYALGSLITFGVMGAIYMGFIAMVFASGGLSQGGAATNPLFASQSAALSPGTQLILMLVLVFWTSLIYVCMMGQTSIAVLHAQGQAPSVANYFLPFKKLKSVVPAVLLMTLPYQLINFVSGEIAKSLGAAPLDPVMFVVPLLLFLFMFFAMGPSYLAITASVFSGLKPVTCYVESFRRMGWNALLLSLLLILASFVSGLGIIACCVGIIFTFPIFTNVIALHYLYYFPPTQPQRLG